VARNSIRLAGCAPGVLMHHLKALGVFRLVAKKDASVRARWEDDMLIMDAGMTGEELVRFFCAEYEPTPVLSPWNKDSALYDPDLLADIVKSKDARLLAYKEAAGKAAKVVASVIPEYGLLFEKVASHGGHEDVKSLVKKAKAGLTDERKAEIRRKLRNVLDDGAVEWLDAVYVLTYDNKAPNGPLLMAGGSDGRTEFSRNFASSVIGCLGAPAPVRETQVRKSLFGPSSGAPAGMQSADEGGAYAAPKVGHLCPGYFMPDATGPTGKQYTIGNPWDYILAIEGAMLFGGGVYRRGNHRFAAFPFAIAATWSGYDTSCEAECKDRSGNPFDRGEIWIPTWGRPASYREVHHAFSDGSVRAGRAPPVTGTGYAVALINRCATRGFDAFWRYIITQRKGQAHHAVLAGRLAIGEGSGVQFDSAAPGLLLELDDWLGRLRKTDLSNSASQSLRLVDDAILRFCMERDPHAARAKLQGVLVATGRLESHLAAAAAKNTRPLERLSPGWMWQCYDNTPEFRLAAALSAIDGADLPTAQLDPKPDAAGTPQPAEGFSQRYPIRINLEPVEFKNGRSPSWKPKSSRAVWSGGDLAKSMVAVLERRCVDGRMVGSKSTIPLGSRIPALVSDVVAFIEGRTDDSKIRDLVLPLSMIRYSRGGTAPSPWGRAYGERGRVPEPYVCAKANFPPVAPSRKGDKPVFEASVVGSFKAGNAGRAVQIMRRRLHIAGYTPPTFRVAGARSYVGRKESARLLASLLIPIREKDRKSLIDDLCNTEERKNASDEDVDDHGSTNDTQKTN